MAAGRTYTPIATTTLGSAQSSVTFSSISGTYTDLVVVINYQASGGAVYTQYRLNSDSGSNYSRTWLYGNGTSAASSRGSNETYIYVDSGTYAASGNWATVITNFNNYANTSTYKTTLTRFGEASIGTEAAVHLWRSTAAISSIAITTNANNFGIGSTFTLYGIAAA